MDIYELEPPRRDCIVHHTYNYIDGDRVIDISPQADDSQIVGDVTGGHTGVLGQSARMQNESANVDVSSADTFFPLSQITALSWSRSERSIDISERNIEAEVVIDGSVYVLSYTHTDTVDDWQYGGVTYDGSTITLWYGITDTQQPIAVDSVDAVGDCDSFDVTFNVNGFGYVDDTRLYKTALSRQQIRNVYRIADEHQTTDQIQTAWTNNGIPIRGTNLQFAEALAEEKEVILRHLDYIQQSFHITDAAGRQLDRIGQLSGISRRLNEDDATYRARIIATLAAGRSSGTFDDILNTIALILDVPVERIELEEAWEGSPTAGAATVNVYVRETDVDDADLSSGDITDIMQDSVVGGHDITIIERGSNPFTVINDSMVTDADKGLTDDTIATGGGLVSDT